MGKGWKAARRAFFCANIATSIDPPDCDASTSPNKDVCSICLETMKPGVGRALFTAECSHTFHFACIASSVKHGNLVCPICRGKWSDVPWKPHLDHAPLLVRQARRRPSTPAAAAAAAAAAASIDPVIRILNESIARHHSDRRSPATDRAYDDDEEVTSSSSTAVAADDLHTAPPQPPKVTALAEAAAVAADEVRDSFTVLASLKAPSCSPERSRRAPIDLITVLDVSGSMAGAKLRLLKLAMEFVVEQLGEHDRLCTIAFSTSGVRLFPLRRMTALGKAEACRCIAALSASGGTNIGDGLKKAIRVLTERRWRNTVSSVMLLSDGQDTVSSSFISCPVPVHSFGFGSDHDPVTLHSVSEASGGTFNFVQTQAGIGDAFAQCIGGLLSIVSQEVVLEFQLTGSKLLRIDHSGLQVTVSDCGSSAKVTIGEMYAEEEKDVLLQLQLPATDRSVVMAVRIGFKDAFSGVSGVVGAELVVPRPVSASEVAPDVAAGVLVGRQRNRLVATEAMAAARWMADGGEFASAQVALIRARRSVEASPAYAAGDRLSVALAAELREVAARMENGRVFAARGGRAYALSACSSHERQRATSTRVEYSSAEDALYLTSSMTEMVQLSQRRRLLRCASSRKKLNPNHG